MDKGNLMEAVAFFQQSIAALPHFKSLELLGECLLKLNRPQEAIVPLAAATSLNPGVRAPSLLAEAFYMLGEDEDSKKFVAIALQRDPKNRKALEMQALISGKNE